MRELYFQTDAVCAALMRAIALHTAEDAQQAAFAALDGWRGSFHNT